LRGLLRRDLLTICAVIFTADVMWGILAPTFSLYAQGLGASLTIVGMLSSVVGVTALLSSMPIGLLSDRIDRKGILAVGMVLFALSGTILALAPNAYWLFPGRVLSGLAMVCTFHLGVAYVGDIVKPEERGLALGLYSTSMGLGFTTGPLVGAALAERYGISGSYLFAAALALLGATIGAIGLRPVRPLGQMTVQTHRLPGTGADKMLRDRRLVAGSLGNLLINITFNGTVANFFPVYAAGLGISQLAINSMFSVRAFFSTLTRLPSAALTNRLPSRVVMVVALILAMAALLMMAQTNSISLLALLLIVEGVSFGAFLTSGQVFVAESGTPATRGAAVGVYSTAGSFGAMISPAVLGVVADLWGLRMVFRLTGALVFVGLVVIGYLNSREISAPLTLERGVEEK
jgi:MFS family permease